MDRTDYAGLVAMQAWREATPRARATMFFVSIILGIASDHYRLPVSGWLASLVVLALYVVYHLCFAAPYRLVNERERELLRLRTNQGATNIASAELDSLIALLDSGIQIRDREFIRAEGGSPDYLRSAWLSFVRSQVAEADDWTAQAKSRMSALERIRFDDFEKPTVVWDSTAPELVEYERRMECLKMQIGKLYEIIDERRK